MSRVGLRLLAECFTSMLSGVPQDMHHHPEGDVLNHTRLVCRAIREAIDRLQLLAATSEFKDNLQDASFHFSPDELRILILAAWLHDIGKVTATTIGGRYWQEQKDNGAVRAIGHERKEHFGPLLDELLQTAPATLQRWALSVSEVNEFLIVHHMDLASESGFSNRFIAEHFESGRLKEDLKLRLLLVLMWADKLGRGSADVVNNGKRTLCRHFLSPGPAGSG